MELERSNHFKIIMKNRNVLELILNLEQLVSANDDVIKNCEIFIETVLHNRTSKETYVETSLRLYNKKKQKTHFTSFTSFRSSVTQESYSSSELSVIFLAALYR